MRHRLRVAMVCTVTLCAPVAQGQEVPGEVIASQKISAVDGGFTGPLAAQDFFGRSVCVVGDLDEDGVVDLAVGAERTDGGLQDEGAVWVLFLNADGTVKSDVQIAEGVGGFAGPLDDDNFGASVAPLGDLNDDGIPDLAVGAPRDDDGGGNNFGAVWILFLEADGSVQSQQKVSATEGGFAGQLDPSDQFGYSLASLGDRDGDGVTDLAVGARQDDDGANGAGAVWLLFLNPDGSVKSSQKISSTSGGLTASLDPLDSFGSSVASVGDLNSDGINDLVVGGANDNDDGQFRGAVWVLFMDASSQVLSDQKISSSSGGFGGDLDDGDEFGWSVAGLGDISGDGVPDIVVGARQDDDGGTNRGAVYVLFLQRDGTVRDHVKISDTQGGFNDGTFSDFANFGASLALLGDLDGDGRADLAAGALGEENGGLPGSGSLRILFLNASPWSPAGEGLAGAFGVPLLEASGMLAGGDPVVFTLNSAKPFAVGTLVVGLSELSAPFKGGSLFPFPDFLITPIVVGPFGTVEVGSLWPIGVPPGLTTHYQYWISDTAGPVGFSASNAISGTTP